MATNEDILAILTLWRRLPERQRQVLLALETFPRREGGWRQAGINLLARTAGLSPRTVAKARGELVKASLIDYQRGMGRGQKSTYRIMVAEAAKVAREVATLKGGKRGCHLSESTKGGRTAPEKLANGPNKGGKQNPLTSANASDALKPSALKSSALPSVRHSGRAGSPRTHQETDTERRRQHDALSRWMRDNPEAAAAPLTEGNDDDD